MVDLLHYRTCNLCEAMCGLELTTSGNEVRHIRGDQNDTFSRGYHCIKGEALADLHHDKSRLRLPLRRTKNGWETLSWNNAFDDVASNIRKIQSAHGLNAVASYIGNPNVHHYGSLIYLQDFLRHLHSKNRFAATSVDQLPHHLAAYFLYGHQLLLPVPDIDRTRFLLILGGNPVVSRGSMMSAPDVTTRLKAIRERGGKVILIDPRRTETAAVADAHHYIRPGTDAVLLLALLQVVFTENRTRPGRVAGFSDGMEKIQELTAAYAPPVAAAITGIPETIIVDLARSFAAADGAVCYGRVGASTQEFGALTQWLVNILNIVTGNLDRIGGAMFTTPAVDPLPYVGRGHFNRWQSRVRGLPEFAGELPVCVLSEEMETPGTGQIKALITVAGNPVLSTPEGQRLERALAKLDYMVAIDIYRNETTRFANIILPPSGPLEHENYDIAFHVLAVRNTAKFSPTCFAPPPEGRHDWQILAALSARLDHGKRPKDLLRRAVTSQLTPERILALGLRFGHYGAGLNPFGKGLTLKSLKNAVHGLDLGALEPRLPTRLFTKNKRINLTPTIYLEDLARLRQRFLLTPSTTTKAQDPETNAKTSFDLLLIGRRQVRVNNSWMGHIPRLTSGRSTCTLLIHPTDANTRGITAGALVTVTSRVGSIVIPVTIVEGIMPGVVSIPHGFGHNRDGTGLTVTETAQGVSVNDITDTEFIDRLSGNAAFNGVPVRLSLAPSGAK